MPLMPVSDGKEDRADGKKGDENHPSREKNKGVLIRSLEQHPTDAAKNKKSDSRERIDKSSYHSSSLAEPACTGKRKKSGKIFLKAHPWSM